MINFLNVLVALLQFFLLILLAVVIGLWWTPIFNHENWNATFARASFFLILFLINFYQIVIKKKNHMAKFLFLFYSLVAFCAICGYAFGFLAIHN